MNVNDTIIPAPLAEDLSEATFSREGANARKALKTGEHCLQVSTTDDYPWGRQLRCIRSIWLELKRGQGFRVVTQTIDPRDGKVCAMKTGTYNKDGLTLLYTDANTGYVEHVWLRFNGTEECVKAAEFLAAHPEVAQILTPEAHEHCWTTLYTYIVLNARYTQWLEGTTAEQKREALCLPAIEAAMKAKAPITALAGVGLSVERVKALTRP